MPYEFDEEAFKRLSPEEQAEVAKLLRSIEDLQEQNPLYFFHPYPRQSAFLSSNARFKWMLGGNRAGKTTVCTIDDLIQAVDREALPEHLLPFKKWEPPFKWRIVGQNMDQVEMVILDALKQWCPKTQLVGNGFDKAYSKDRKMLHFKNGSTVQFKTYEQEAQTHAGARFHRVRFDEEPPMDIFNENRVRLIDYGGDMLVGMTPVEGLTWMYDQFYVPFERGDLKDAFVQLVDMDDNPHLSQDSKRVALEGYSAEERKARKTGAFVHFHGLVYPEFTDDLIVPQVEEVPPNAHVYCGIDPGIRHMFAIVFAFHDENDDLVVFDELALKDVNAKDVAEAWHLKCAGWNVRPNWSVIDPSAQNRMVNTGRNMQMELSDHGLPTFPGQNDVRAGINRMKVRLENRKLFVSANCEHTIQQFRQYRWMKPPRKAQEDAREAPIKKDDHLLDALRYLVMARPYAPLDSAGDRRPVDPLAALAWDDMRSTRNRGRDLPGQFY